MYTSKMVSTYENDGKSAPKHVTVGYEKNFKDGKEVEVILSIPSL